MDNENNTRKYFMKRKKLQLSKNEGRWFYI